MRYVVGLLIQTLTVPLLAGAELVPFDSPRWEVSAAESRIEEHLGRTSFFLRGGIALVADAELVDGVIEFDIAFAAERVFAGATWRVVDAANREELYLRAHQSGNPDANQYTPVFNGLTAWQLYHGEGYGSPVVYDVETWMPVRIVFSGTEAEVYIRDLDTPALFIHDLKREPVPGKVGLSVANFGPARFADFRYTVVDRPALKGKVERTMTARPGTVMTWQVSNTFDEASLDGVLELTTGEKSGLTWSSLRCEPTGLANLSRLHPVEPQRQTVFARVSVVSDRPQTKSLAFGYSDRVRLFLDDRLLYSGDNGYRSRDYRYLGTIGYFDEVYVPLEKGSNELWLAVSESFGGWGVQAAFCDLEGITIVE